MPNLLDSVPPTDSNSNQIDEEPPLVAASVQDAKPSSCLETVTEASEYHWCEDDEDLSEANRAAGQQSSCSSDHIREESITESRLLIGSDPSYVELAKQIDTDLAHIDMEDFKSEDIHTLLIDYSQNCAIPNNVADMHDSMEETPSSQVTAVLDKFDQRPCCIARQAFRSAVGCRSIMFFLARRTGRQKTPRSR